MIDRLTQHIIDMIDENSPELTLLFCYIYNLDIGMAILDAVKRNKYLTEWSIMLNEDSPDIAILRLIRSAITFHIQDNDRMQNMLVNKFSIFAEAENIRSKSYQQKLVSNEAKI